MQRPSLAVLAAFALTAPSLAQEKTLKLEPDVVRDRQTTTQDAIRLLKPQGWTLRGGINWYHQLAHLACVEVTISDPLSKARIETFPWHYCNWITNPVMPMQPGTNYLGCIVAEPISDPREVVRKITLPSLRANLNARIVSHTDMPQVAATLAAQFGMGTTVKSGRTRVEYTLDGVAMEEDFYLSVFVTKTSLGGATVSHLWGPAWTPFSLRAEKGQLDAMTPLMLACVNSAKPNERWFAEYQYVCQLFQNRQYDSIRAAGELSRRIARNSDDIRRMYSDAYRQRSESLDRLSARFSDYIRGVERYHSPAESYPVQLPSGYQNVWYGSNGTYLLSNQAGFDPNVGSTTSWQRLEAVR